MKKSIFYFLFFLAVSGFSQETRQGVFISNNITSFPVTTYPQLFYSQLHPGIDIFRSWKLNKSEKNQIHWAVNVGGYYHRFIQTNVRMYPSVFYERFFGSRFYANIGLGGGYSLAFENMETFTLQDDGTYKKKTLVARSQYLVQLGFGFNYALKKDKPDGARLLLQFKTFIQGPFVSGYVPMLPVNSLMLGFSVPFNKK
jgi:hypothetical protein